jgi:hypothetical protein
MDDARPVMYLNFNQANSGCLGDRSLPRDYVAACRFMHCGVIDRTGALPLPFSWQVFDSIPVTDDSTSESDFGALCDARGDALVAEAVAADATIRHFWSGGIDSTSALIALMRAVERRRCPERLCVLLSMESVLEYPEFYLRFIDDRFAVEAVRPPMAQALQPGALSVTGEHGDQLFGSQLLAPYVRRGVAHEPYRDLLPLVMLERLRNPLAARSVERYLQPVLDAAPAPIVSLFDALWWLNFSLKWQDVSLRMVGLSGGLARARFGALRHFFRTDAFQRWSIATTPGRPVRAWTDYKAPAKEYICAFTGDDRYFRQKIKEDSLRNVLGASSPVVRNRIFMRADFVPMVTVESPREPGRFARLFRAVQPPRGPTFPEYGR